MGSSYLLELCLCPSRSRWSAARWVPLVLISLALVASVVVLAVGLGGSRCLALFTGPSAQPWDNLYVDSCADAAQTVGHSLVLLRNGTEGTDVSPVEVIYSGLVSGFSVCKTVEYKAAGTPDGASNCEFVQLEDFSMVFNVSSAYSPPPGTAVHRAGSAQCQLLVINGTDFSDSMAVGGTMVSSAIAFGVASVLMTILRGVVLQMRSRTLCCDSCGPKLSLLITFVVGVCFAVFSVLAWTLYVTFLPDLLRNASSPVYPAWRTFSDLHMLLGVSIYAILYVIFLIIDGGALLYEEYRQRHDGYTEIRQRQSRDPNSLRSPNLHQRYNGGRRRTPDNSLRDALSSIPTVNDDYQ